MLIFSSSVYAVGSREITRHNINEFDAKLEIKFSKFQECYKILATLPNEVTFKELGKREIWSASYEKINNQNIGWQIASKGTKIKVPLIEDEVYHTLGSVCLNKYDLDSGFLTVVYGGPQGTPPMVLVFKLVDFIE